MVSVRQPPSTDEILNSAHLAGLIRLRPLPQPPAWLPPGDWTTLIPALDTKMSCPTVPPGFQAQPRLAGAMATR